MIRDSHNEECDAGAPLQSCSSNAGMTRRFSILILEHVRCKEGHTVYEIKLFCIIIGCTERQCKKRKEKEKEASLYVPNYIFTAACKRHRQHLLRHQQNQKSGEKKRQERKRERERERRKIHLISVLFQQCKLSFIYKMIWRTRL